MIFLNGLLNGQKCDFQVANGRIARPGEVDAWPVLLKKGETVDLEVRAGRLGSPLDSVLTVVDDTGKELAQNDDVGGAVSDSRLSFAAPADGTFLEQWWKQMPPSVKERVLWTDKPYIIYNYLNPQRPQ